MAEEFNKDVDIAEKSNRSNYEKSKEKKPKRQQGDSEMIMNSRGHWSEFMKKKLQFCLQCKPGRRAGGGSSRTLFSLLCFRSSPHMEKPEGLKCFSLSPDADDHKYVVFSAAIHSSKSICVLLTGCRSTSKWLKLSFSSSSSLSPPPEDLAETENRPLVWGKAVNSTYFAAFDVGNERWTENHDCTREVVDYCLKTQQPHLRPSDPPADGFHRGWYRICCRDFSRISDPDLAVNENCSSLAFGRHFSSIGVHNGKIYFWCWRSLQALVFNPPDPIRGKGDWGCLSPYPREFVNSFLRRPHNFFALSLSDGIEGDQDKILLVSKLSESQYIYDAGNRDWGLFQHPEFSKNVYNVEVDSMLSCGTAIFWIDVMSNYLCCYDLRARKYLHGPLVGIPMPSEARSNLVLVLFSKFCSTCVPTRFCVIWTEYCTDEDGALSSTNLHYCVIQAYKASDDPEKLVSTLLGGVFVVELPQYFVLHDAFLF